MLANIAAAGRLVDMVIFCQEVSFLKEGPMGHTGRGGTSPSSFTSKRKQCTSVGFASHRADNQSRVRTMEPAQAPLPDAPLLTPRCHIPSIHRETYKPNVPAVTVATGLLVFDSKTHEEQNMKHKHDKQSQSFSCSAVVVTNIIKFIIKKSAPAVVSSA